jgi:prepilin-type N-terminal cleavage/methylation domain-containing protein
MNKSFTLIEILVVIVVIGILSAFILVGMSSISSSANIAKSQAFLNSMDNSLLMAKVSQWKLDNGTIGNSALAGDVIDSWGSNNAVGTYTSPGPLIRGGTDCISGKCLNFDGDDFINFGTSSSYNFGNGTSDNPFSLSGWFKMNDATNCGFMGRQAGGVYQYGFYSGGSDKLTFALYDADLSNYIARRSVAVTNYENKWINLVGTYDGLTIMSGIKIYLNGERIDSADLAVGSYIAMESASLNFYLGTIGGLYMNGQIDDVRIYNQAIPTSQIQQNYYIGLNRLYNSNNVSKKEYVAKIREIITQNP